MELIKHKRKRLGLSQCKLAELAGVHKQTIYNIEAGKLPSTRTLMKIEEVLKFVKMKNK
jgi:transcriptional regulator with XRE-family HTH domain